MSGGIASGAVLTVEQREKIKSKLKLCPFCRQKPKLVYFANCEWQIQCDNFNCTVRPHALRHRDLVKAAEYWNGRKEKELRGPMFIRVDKDTMKMV